MKILGMALLCLALCGCQPDNSKKLDQIENEMRLLVQAQSSMWSNQVSIYHELEETKNQVYLSQQMAYFYHTNALDELKTQCVLTELGIKIETTRLISENEKLVESKIEGTGKISEPDSLAGMNEKKAQQDIDEILTHVELMGGDVDDVKTDVEQIKSKLGIIY